MSKRIITCVLAFLLIAVILSGCVTVDRTWEFLHSTDKISSIELYNFATFVMHDIPEDAEPIAYIAEDQYDAFCKGIQELEFSELIILFPVAYDPSWYLEGYTVKITYDNGDIEVIANEGFQYQNVVEGRGSNRHYNLDDDADSAWNSLIEAYLETEE